VYHYAIDLLDGLCLNRAWAKLALWMKIAPTLQPFLFEILTWGLLHLVDIEQT
jgi:hypothetical protein